MPKKEQRKRFSRPASSSSRRPQRQSERRIREQDPNTIPSYLVNHLAQALRMVLKLDGPADVLLSVYFKRNHELGSRDRGFVAEAVYAALRHLAGIRWRMAPAVPERSPRLAALVTLASLYGMEALDSRDVGNDRKALEAILDKRTLMRILRPALNSPSGFMNESAASIRITTSSSRKSRPALRSISA